jgi:LPXTG-motif cell wall-anchored protein
MRALLAAVAVVLLTPGVALAEPSVEFSATCEEGRLSFTDIGEGWQALIEVEIDEDPGQAGDVFLLEETFDLAPGDSVVTVTLPDNPNLVGDVRLDFDVFVNDDEQQVFEAHQYLNVACPEESPSPTPLPTESPSPPPSVAPLVTPVPTESPVLGLAFTGPSTATILFIVAGVLLVAGVALVGIGRRRLRREA